MPTAEVNNIQLYYEVRGEGQPLVVLVGPGTGISERDSIIGWLAHRYRVTALDNRGAGRSDKPDQPYSIELMAEDTEGLLKALAIQRAHVLGISMGGSKYPQPRYFSRRQLQVSFTFDCTARLAEIQAPTLILHGTHAKRVPYALAEQMQAGIANSSPLAFEGGHIFFFSGGVSASLIR